MSINFHKFNFSVSKSLVGKTLPCYISDIFSPTRLYVQLCEPEITKIICDLKEFYSNRQNAQTFELKASQVKVCNGASTIINYSSCYIISLQVGLKIAMYVCKEWHRAEILSDVTASGRVYGKKRSSWMFLAQKLI